MGINLTELSNKIKKLPIQGKVWALVKRVLFINAAVITGLWLGIKLFFPDDFVLSKINEQLFLKDLALTADDVSLSLLGNISFEDGILMQKGEKALTFSELSFSPSLFATFGGHPAGKVYVKDINAQDGELEATFETNDNPCYTFESNELPLSVLKPFLGEIVITGSLTGNGDVCRKENKYSGKIELKGDDIVLRGKVPTPMGDFDVGKIILGEIELTAEITDNKAEIKHLTVKGIVELDATGKVTLNTRTPAASRLDINIKAKVPDMAKIEENVALNLLAGQLEQYKTEGENSFAFTLKGFANKPIMGKAHKERDFKNEVQRKRPEKPQRLPSSERLPQKPKPLPEPAANPENTESKKIDLQNDELKKKEDELKRKEDELRKKEEDAKEREEKMREEREQREKEEKERREREEKNRMEEEARIHAVQEEAMNEIRRAREEIEAEKLKDAPRRNEGDEERPKPANDEKEEE